MNSQEEQGLAMNLPIHNHLDRLSQLVTEIRAETTLLEKDLQVLRGNITQFSYINKNSDQELNDFLIGNISSLRTHTESDWELNHIQTQENKKAIYTLCDAHQDIELERQSVNEKVHFLQTRVGLA